MSSTLHSVFFTLKVSILLGSLLGLCLGLEFMGLPNQWARYLRWDASTRSDLSFQFKTNVSTGLLLYLDDGGICDFLCLSLVDGRVQLRFSMDCAETAVLSNKQVNDSSWHFLMVSRDRLRTVLMLDGEGQSGELQPQRPYMDVVSDLFLGGVPADIRPSALTLDGVQAMPGFKGLILDLKYGNSEPRLLGSQGVQLDAEGPCGERPCENGGICFLLDGHPTCDCSTTGYGGKLCSEGLSHLMMSEQGRCFVLVVLQLPEPLASLPLAGHRASSSLAGHSLRCLSFPHWARLAAGPSSVGVGAPSLMHRGFPSPLSPWLLHSPPPFVILGAGPAGLHPRGKHETRHDGVDNGGE
uniref:Neurexin 3 n=1 Tax=Macaca mulatta TaxID=9544 RepID=A0A5F8A498_MACMU